MPSLKKWAKEELAKAKKNKVHHLRLATSAELREEHITELEALNDNIIESFKVWGREILDLRIKQQPFLRYYYFQSPSIPLFVPASIYFNSGENDLFDKNITNEISTLREQIDKLQSFLSDESKKIFVIDAPGGYGKTHFLREIPRVIEKTKSDREIESGGF